MVEVMKGIGLHSQTAQARRGARARGAGFSLIEVLFAVVILTMGLVFVAAQFPIGIMNSRHIADATMDIVDAHNAQVMLELKLGPLKSSPIFNSNILIPDQNVHALVKANVLVNRTVVLDEIPDDPAYIPIPAASYSYPFLAPYLTVNFNSGLLDGRNIGAIVSPAVDESDREVQASFNFLYDPANDADGSLMSEAIGKVALLRDYNWSSLYQFVGSNTYRFFTFTMRTSKKAGARYAMQSNPVEGELGIQGVAYDRRFPVPWRVQLGLRFVIDLKDPPNPFRVSPAGGELLREGSYLIDADSRFHPDVAAGLTTGLSGFVYEVVEIVPEFAGGDIVTYWIRLNTGLRDDLDFIWVVPPAIVSRSPVAFDDVQPVVQVTQQVIQF